MGALDKIETVVVLILMVLFWTYVAAGVVALIASAFEWTILPVIVAFLETFVIYIFVGMLFLLFWPIEDEGPYLS